MSRGIFIKYIHGVYFFSFLYAIILKMKIVSVAPTRISLFGGGTDVDPYAGLYGGLCVNFSINLRTTIILFSEYDKIDKKNITPENGDLKFIEKIVKEFNLNVHSINNNSIRIQSFFDGIIGAGLGSSASCTVALIGAINKLRDTNFTKDVIAQLAYNIEVNKMKKHGGKQDQYACTYGNGNIFRFCKKRETGTPHFIPLKIHYKILDSMALFYIGHPRKSSEIQNNFKELDNKKKETLDKIKEIAIESIVPIRTGKIDTVTDLMEQSWKLKKKSNAISNQLVETAYNTGIECGALAGKLLGAGQGGYMIFFCNRFKKKEFIEKMTKRHMKHIDFSIDHNGLETRII